MATRKLFVGLNAGASLAEVKAAIVGRLSFAPLSLEELVCDLGKVPRAMLKAAVDEMLRDGQVRQTRQAGENFFALPDYQPFGQLPALASVSRSYAAHYENYGPADMD